MAVSSRQLSWTVPAAGGCSAWATAASAARARMRRMARIIARSGRLRHNRRVRFGRWQPLADAAAPAGPSVLEARLGDGADGLVAYPRGKSAMVYYDADAAPAAALARLRARAPAAE